MPRRLQYPIKRSPKSDPQQYRVYRMENEAIGARKYMRMDQGSIRALVRSISRNYKMPAPEIRFTDLGKWAAEWHEKPSTGRPLIFFNTKKGTANDILTVTHEMAHHLHWYLDQVASMEQEAHGPEFMACHMSILDTCRVVPVVGMRAICDSYDIRYADPGTTHSLEKLRRCVKKSAKKKGS